MDRWHLYIKVNALLIFLLSTGHWPATAQTLDELVATLKNKQYAETIHIGNELIKLYPEQPEVYELTGEAHLARAEYDTAANSFRQAIKHDGDRTWVSSWAHVHLAEALMAEGNMDSAIPELVTAVAIKRTQNSVAYAQSVLDSLRYISLRKNSQVHYYSPDEPKWIIIEGSNITYYFQDTAVIAGSVKQYMDAHEQAYEKINKIFQAVLPVKMIFYVWSDTGLASKILRKELGFTLPEQCITNTRFTQSTGHEMTHTLVYWAWGIKPVKLTWLINEGVAVAFDQSKGSKYLKAKNALQGKNISGVLQLWQLKSRDDELIYPLGGALVEYLFKNSTPSQFKSIMKDQTIENGQQTYGVVVFGKMIKDFDDMMGLR